MSENIKLFLMLMQINYIFSTYPSIQKCQLSDSNCLKDASQNAIAEFSAGVPELLIGTEVLDVMKIESIQFELSGLQLHIKNATLKGLKKAVVEKISFNTKKEQMELKLHGELLLKGQYVAKGRLLILPIRGDGQLTIKIKKVVIDIVMPYEIVQNSNGKDVIDLQSYKFKFDFRDNVHFHLTNLFNGNKQLSDVMHQFINDNWKQVADEFGKPIIDEAYKKVFQSIKLFLNQQPIEDLIIEEN